MIRRNLLFVVCLEMNLNFDGRHLASIYMATNALPAALISSASSPGSGVSAVIPTSGKAIAAEVAARNASIGDKFASLDATPSLVKTLCA